MFDRLADITATTDLNGNAIEVGTRVRSFDFPLMTSEGLALGLELEGERASYMEGVVEAIGEDDIEGCRRYRILVDKMISGGMDREVKAAPGQRPLIYPPLNGTPTFGSKCFGVLVA